MNFYQAQDQALKQSRILLLLFSVAVLVLIVITNFAVALFALYSNPEFSLNARPAPAFSLSNFFEWCRYLASALGWQKALWTTCLVSGLIFIAMAFKWINLRKGGRVVAEALGGSLVQPNTRDPQEKRLLNIVEEIALASGTPVPPVYVLKSELGMNAFAAGLTQEDAVVAVTQGSLNSFNREQLQGVIAHEFSHILNGDMRLNMKLIAVLHGILMIAESGRFFMRIGSARRHSRNSDKNNGMIYLYLLGLCLLVIGFTGQILGALIKAAVSRQREFLADASAVKFTRNPEGVAQALSIIGGAPLHSSIQHHSAHELSHLFFSDATGFLNGNRWFHPSKWSLFATHPPLKERIKRIQPGWSGQFLTPENNIDQVAGFSQPDPAYPAFAEIQAKQEANQSKAAFLDNAIDFVPASLTDNSIQQALRSRVIGETSLNTAAAESDPSSALSENGPVSDADISALMQMVHQPYDASLFMLTLVLSHDEPFQQKQHALIAAYYPEDGDKRIRGMQSIQEKLGHLDARQKLDLIEMALPSLKLMSLKQYKRQLAVLIKLIQVDGQVQIFDWLLVQLIKQNLDGHFSLSRPLAPRYKTLDSLARHYEIVLSRVVHYGFEDQDAEDIDAQDKMLAFLRACDVAGIKGLKLLDVSRCEGKLFSQAVHALGLAVPLLKPRLLKGCLAAVQFDGQITDQERYVITAIACVMDCPLIGLDEMTLA